MNIVFLVYPDVEQYYVQRIANLLGVKTFRQCIRLRDLEKKENELIIILCDEYDNMAKFRLETTKDYLDKRGSVGIYYYLEPEFHLCPIKETNTFKVVFGGIRDIAVLKSRMTMLGYVFDEETKQAEPVTSLPENKSNVTENKQIDSTKPAEKNICFFSGNVDKIMCQNIADLLGVKQFRHCECFNEFERKDDEIIIFLYDEFKEYSTVQINSIQKVLNNIGSVGIFYCLTPRFAGQFYEDTDTLKTVFGGLENISGLKEKMTMLGYMFDKETKQVEPVTSLPENKSNVTDNKQIDSTKPAEKNIVFVVDESISLNISQYMECVLGLKNTIACKDLGFVKKQENELIIFITPKYLKADIEQSEKLLKVRKSVGIHFVMKDDFFPDTCNVKETDTFKIVFGGLENIDGLKEKMTMLGYVFDEKITETKQVEPITSLPENKKTVPEPAVCLPPEDKKTTPEPAKYDWSKHDLTHYDRRASSSKILTADYLKKCKVLIFVSKQIDELAKMDLESGLNLTMPVTCHYNDVVDCFNYFGYRCTKLASGKFIVSL